MSEGLKTSADLLGYEGKVCVVTGSASGIGKAVCDELIGLGAQVYGLDRNEYAPTGLKEFIQTDLSQNERAPFFEHFYRKAGLFISGNPCGTRVSRFHFSI